MSFAVSPAPTLTAPRAAAQRIVTLANIDPIRGIGAADHIILRRALQIEAQVNQLAVTQRRAIGEEVPKGSETFDFSKRLRPP